MDFEFTAEQVAIRDTIRELVQDRVSRKPHHELGARTTQKCFELGLSMNIRRRPERGSVWRIAPPLTVSTDENDRAIVILNQALAESLIP